MKDLADSRDDRAGCGAVRRRRVCFISGFDPNGPRRYHRLYRQEGARQAALSGYGLEVGDLIWGDEAARWRVVARHDAGTVETEVLMLRWDDIARARLRIGPVGIYGLMLRTLWRYVGSGAFVALCRVRFISTLVGLYPVAMLLVWLAVAGGLTAGGTALAPELGAPWPVGALAGAAAGAAFLRAMRRFDGRLMAHYLMCDFGFTAAEAAGEAPEMETRLNVFAALIARQRARGDCDETLIVGHSSGAAYAVSVAARARAAEVGGEGRLSLLTLGQTIPMLSFLPGAARLRAELAALAGDDGVDWIDVSTPADGACYALTDAPAVSGAVPAGRAACNPKVISARFADGASPALDAEMRASWFRLHIQYLCAFDRPGDYDYFAITAGPARLAERFAARRTSPQVRALARIQRRLRG